MFLVTYPASAEAQKVSFGGIIPENTADGHGLQDQEGARASVIGGTAEAAAGNGGPGSDMNATGDDELEGGRLRPR